MITKQTKQTRQTTIFHTVDEARLAFEAGLDAGIECPLCHRHAKRYRRALDSLMARALIIVARYFQDNQGAKWLAAEDHFQRVNAPKAIRGDFHKLRWWGFLEKADGQRPDGSDRIGLWRITPEGMLFAQGQIFAPKYAVVLFGQLEHLESPMVKIQECLGQRFDYSELMQTAAP